MTAKTKIAAEQPRGRGTVWPLFSAITAIQGEAPFGRVLDAGTGPRSIRWLSGLDTEAITAVTGEAMVAGQVQRLLGEWQRPQDRMIVGNWSDAALLAGEQFDTVLADYLLGSVERVAPYFQERLFARLRALTGGRIYIIGSEPYVVDRPGDQAGALIWEVGRFRDACLTLLGKQHYREYPLEWVIAQLRRSGFKPVATRKFRASYKAEFINTQIDLSRAGLARFEDRALAQALDARGETLRRRALEHIEAHGSISYGFSYLVAADAA